MNLHEPTLEPLIMQAINPHVLPTLLNQLPISPSPLESKKHADPGICIMQRPRTLRCATGPFLILTPQLYDLIRRLHFFSVLQMVRVVENFRS
jgi:hypothetical protein